MHRSGALDDAEPTADLARVRWAVQSPSALSSLLIHAARLVAAQSHALFLSLVVLTVADAHERSPARMD